jgi:hypothetical protein
MAVTTLVLARHFRAQMSLEERTREARRWPDRILDLRGRVKIVESAWRSIVTKELQAESELMQARDEMQSKLQSELSREI